MSQESEILDLMRQADTEQFDRDINKLERLVDIGDRMLAQRVVLAAADSERIEGTLAALNPERQPEVLNETEGEL